MIKWKTYRLGDITIMRNGKKRPNTQGIYPVYGGNGIMDYADCYNAENAIIVGRVGAYCGNVYQSKGKCWVSDNAISVSATELVDSCFLYYLMSSIDFHHHHIGGAQPLMTQDIIGGFEIFLPSLAEQRRIAEILGAIDDKIENNRCINTNLELHAQALYKQWFVDFEFPNEEGKPYKSSGGKMVDSELGPIPEGWSVGKLEDIGDIIGGGTPSKAAAEYYTKNGIAWITPKDLSVSHSKFTAKGETDITELGYKNSSAKIMPRGSVLFSSRAPIGYISIAKNDICTNQGFKSVVPNNGCTAFVYYFLLSNTENIESKATGSTFKEASGALMKSLDLVIPSEDILENFENIMSPIFELQEKFEAENENLATLRDTLLPKLMNGEIKVTE